MEKSPIPRKTSILADSAGEKGQRKAGRIISPTRLAQLIDRTERTVREYCKKGVIAEAFQTPGGHWRIRWPLSMTTRYELERRQPYWRKGRGGDLRGDWNPDIAESLMLSLICEVDLGDPLLVEVDDGDPILLLHLAERADHQDDCPWTGTAKEIAARQIQDDIIRRVETGEPFWDLILKGSVYQFWRKNQRQPTVAEIVELLGISRDTYYRRYSLDELNGAYFVATGESGRDLPDPDGLDQVQRANAKARVVTVDRDPYSDD